MSLDLNENIQQTYLSSDTRPHWVRWTYPNISYVNLVTGCPKHWLVIGNSCYYMTGENSQTINDAQNKCKRISAKLPIIKSESENNFILGLMSKQKPWVWLGMKRKHGKMLWFDDTPTEPSDGALYSAWKANEPSNNQNEDCAYMDFHSRGWTDDKCHYTPNTGPYVFCQKERYKGGS